MNCPVCNRQVLFEAIVGAICHSCGWSEAGGDKKRIHIMKIDGKWRRIVSPDGGYPGADSFPAGHSFDTKSDLIKHYQDYFGCKVKATEIQGEQ